MSQRVAADPMRAAKALEPVTASVIEAARQYTFAELPADVIAVAKQCVLDCLTTTIAAMSEPAVELVRAEVLAAGGHPLATLIGTGERVSLQQAALVNGTAAHALDFDDVSAAMVGHPSAPILPALLAVAQNADLAGPAFLTAFVAGVETACRVGRLMAPDHYNAGWHATGTVGTFGAAAACAAALDLDTDQWHAAFGLAGAQAAGLKSMFGTMSKPLQAGNAAANGLFAVHLARRGFTADPGVLESAQGFAGTQTTSRNAADVLERSSDDYDIRDILFKVHAACYYTHSSIDAVTQLVAGHDLRPEQIADLELLVPPQHLDVCNIAEPTTALAAKFSLRFTAALVMAGIGCDIDAFTDQRVIDPALTSLRDRVAVTPDPAMTNLYESLAVLTTTSGEVLSARLDLSQAPRGPELAAQWSRLASKSRSLVTPYLGAKATTDLIDAIAALDQETSMAEFVERTVAIA
jgi:2-methylcitrate dehydratase PrpD